jgi:RNA recognition motif-containing protein
MERFGEVASVRIIGDKGYGFVAFTSADAAGAAVSASVGGMASALPNVGGKVIRISWARGKLPGWKAASQMEGQGREGDVGREAHYRHAAAVAAKALLQSGERLPHARGDLMPGRSLVSYTDLF